jgi:hypothetical protein
MNLGFGFVEKLTKTGSWPIKMVGDEVVLITLVSDKGDDVVGEGVAWPCYDLA